MSKERKRNTGDAVFLIGFIILAIYLYNLAGQK